ncbi:MAG: hypothetical protein HY231_24065 [Acidobacteria bacterium]|nr:hypothetical protein [Acidobacteriota bacterium]
MSQAVEQHIINHAKTIAALGLVAEDREGFDVHSAGFRKEVFRVFQDQEGRVRCSCATYDERRASVPDFRCEHLLAVKFYLETEGADASKRLAAIASFVCRPIEAAKPTMRQVLQPVTPRQLGTIRAIANSLKINPDEECQAVMNCRIEDLNRKTASRFIEHLEARDRHQPEDGRAVEVLKKFTEAVHAKHQGLHELANRAYYEAQQLWQRWQEETAVLRKPQGKTNGTYHGVEW